MAAQDRHQRATNLFLTAADLAPERRGAFLDEACGADRALREEVEGMLIGDASEGDFETPALGHGFAVGWATNDHVRDGGARRIAPGEGDADAPSRIGDFRILGSLGAGGMGIVYLAEQERPARRVALKVLRPWVFTSRAQRRFEMEADHLARLHHPAIAQVYEAGLAQDVVGARPYIAMELVEGEPIDTYCDAHALSRTARLELLSVVCKAMHHAHQKGIVHRDLKPANILVNSDGAPKIVDFGIARALDSNVGGESLHTRAGELIGTLSYMSPEQASADAGDLDTRSDVYSLGVIGYQLLAGRLPIDVTGKPFADALRLIRETAPPPLGAIDQTLRGDLETIVSKALEKEPSRRYPSASDLAADIERHLRHEPIVARPPSMGYQLRKMARRHRAVVVGSLAALTALVLGLGATTWQSIRVTIQRDRALRAEAESRARLRDVRDIANRFVFEIYDDLSGVAGTAAARERLVETALLYLDAMSDSHPADLELQREIAEGYIRAGDVLGNPLRPSLGDTGRSLASYERARTILRSMPVPADLPSRLSLVRCAIGIAEVREALGDGDAALRAYGEAIDACNDVSRIDPASEVTRMHLARAMSKMGYLLSRSGASSDAVAYLEQGVVLGQGLLDERPDDAARIHMLAGSLHELACVNAVLGQTQTSLANLRRSVELGRQCIAAAPLNATYQRTLYLALLYLGDTLAEVEDHVGALDAFREAEQIARHLVAVDPDDRVARKDLGLVCERIGYAHEVRGERDEALAAFEEGLRARSDVSAADPRDVGSLQHTLQSMLQVGQALNSLGRRDEALAQLTRGDALAQQIVAMDPDNAHAQDLAVVASAALGDACRDAGRLSDAVDHYSRATGHASALVSRDPTHTGYQERLADMHRKQAIVLARGDRHQEALDRYRDALAIRVRLATADPDSARLHVEIATIRAELGQLLANRLERADEGLAEYGQARDLLLAHTVLDPQLETTNRLAMYRAAIGRLLLRMNRPSEAAGEIEAALALFDQIVEAKPNRQSVRRSRVRALHALIEAEWMAARQDVTEREPHLRHAIALADRTLAELDALEQEDWVATDRQALEDRRRECLKLLEGADRDDGVSRDAEPADSGS